MLHFRLTWRYSRYLVGQFWSWLLWLIKRLARICSLAMWDWTDRWRKRPECTQKCLVWVVMFGVGCCVSDSNCNVWILTVPTVLYFFWKLITKSSVRLRTEEVRQLLVAAHNSSSYWQQHTTVAVTGGSTQQWQLLEAAYNSASLTQRQSPTCRWLLAPYHNFAAWNTNEGRSISAMVFLAVYDHSLNSATATALSMSRTEFTAQSPVHVQCHWV